MEDLNFTQEQIKKIIDDFAKQKGISFALKFLLETIMKTERQIHNQINNNLSNGFRSRNMLTDGTLIELKVPRATITKNFED